MTDGTTDSPPPPAWWRDPWLWLAMLLVGGMLGWLSVLRYTGYNTQMLDLGNMAQAIWSATQGAPLVFTQPFGQMSRLSGHVEFIYFLVAIPYALVPDPRTLLVLQAAAFASGAIPIYRMAMRHLGERALALALVLIYLFYPVAQTGILFDFHADTLAAPLLLFALDAYSERAWVRYGVFIALALISKVYVAVAVLAIAAYAFLFDGHRRVGVITGVAAVSYALVAFFGIRPLFVDATQPERANTTARYLDHYFGTLLLIGEDLPGRIINAMVVYLPLALLALRGWQWVLLSAPLALGVLVSTGPGPAYDYRYHHYALLVPFLVMAALLGVQRMQQRGGAWRGRVWFTLAMTVLACVVLVDIPLNPLFWQGTPRVGIDHSQYGHLPRDDFRTAWLAQHAPPDVPLIASALVTPQLANRTILHQLRYPNDEEQDARLSRMLPLVDYVIADALFDRRGLDEGIPNEGPATEQQQIAQMLREPDFALTVAQDGMLLFVRQPTPRPALAQTIAALPAPPGGTPVATFGDSLTLWEATVQPVPDTANRYEATLVWQHTGDAPLPNSIAVSHFDGVPFSRVPHLPTYALQPVALWQPGDVYRETFQFAVAPGTPPGSYPWRVGWYDMTHVAAYSTDERSRLPGSDVVLLGTLTVGEVPQ